MTIFNTQIICLYKKCIIHVWNLFSEIKNNQYNIIIMY